MIPAPQLGWMAGVIDFKGRLVRKNNHLRRTPQIVLVVETKEYSIVRGLARLTGTSPEMMKAQALKEWMRTGCSEHCPEPHIHVTRDGLMMPAVARWTVTGAAMNVVLHNVSPYLVTDRGYIQAMAEVYANTRLVGQGATAVLNSLQRLKDLGWEMPEQFAEGMQMPHIKVLEASPPTKIEIVAN